MTANDYVNNIAPKSVNSIANVKISFVKFEGYTNLYGVRTVK